jgi:sulfite exporter TauE/SafE
MLIEINYFAAFLVALLGGVHCVGMCGGIVGALGLGFSTRSRRRGTPWPFLFAYNAGRLLSYTMAGALAGGFGAWAANLASVRHGQQFLQLLAGFFLLALGLYLADWWRGLARLERAGGLVWRRLEPFGRRWLPLRTPAQALGIGLIWGWLPCGLVYSALIWAIGAGSAREGALLMLSFGLGTLPALLVMGVFANALAGFARDRRVRRVAGALVIGFGCYQVAQVFS